ncbi:hypothetical protein O181_068425 [Austropuccinia psidii MF-1]|uniref:Wax synthase domain-containing protein n=1 Tax=Austropuccinia psidii MF-1 TaxID=1389203 RepID=A0A9Q3F0Z6_9BASI|nr:hypothetical protein [Austropuccinia psidii MF-1]
MDLKYRDWLAHWAEARPPPWHSPLSWWMLAYHIPIFLQALLTHPALATHDNRLRWWRLALLPINLRLSFGIINDFCFTPITRRGCFNLSLACWGLHLAGRSLEWALFSNQPTNDAYQIQPQFLKSKQSQSASRSPSQFDLCKDIIAGSLDRFFSLRGLKYGWGRKLAEKERSLCYTVKLVVISHYVQMIALVGCILFRDHGSALNAWMAIGLPNFPGALILAEGLASLAFGFLIIAGMELSAGYLALLSHFITWVSQSVSLPFWFVSFWDPKLFIPLFHIPHQPPSLAWFWGKGWHQLFRRGYLICGALPASRAAAKLGFGLKAQRILGLFGSFLVSGIQHEIAIRFVARPTHPSPHVHFISYPGSLVFFLIQPIGILLEPYIIPLIPHSLGGAWTWTIIFILWTCIPFRDQYMLNYRVIDYLYPPLERWHKIGFAIPYKIMEW